MIITSRIADFDLLITKHLSLQASSSSLIIRRSTDLLGQTATKSSARAYTGQKALSLSSSGSIMIANVVGEVTPPYTTPMLVMTSPPSWMRIFMSWQKCAYALMMVGLKFFFFIDSIRRLLFTVSNALRR